MGLTDEQIIQRLRELLGSVDLQTTTEKMLRKKLEEEFKQDLSGKKALIREQVEKYLLEQEAAAGKEDEAEEQDEEASEEEENDEEPTSDEDRPRGKSRRGGAGGSVLSPELQEFLGVESMARPQVVRELWKYIKEHNLQDPSNKRNILLDEKLATIFDPPITIFSMNKQLSKHVKAAGADAVSSGGSGAARKRPKAVAPSAKRAKGEGGGGGGGFQKEMPITAELAALVGKDRASRTELTKFFWDYFKKNELLDPEDKRFVVANDTLRSLFGEDRFQAFGIQRLISNHIVKD